MSQPIVTVKLTVEFEAKYNPFAGRTPQQFGATLEDDLHSALLDFREEDVTAFFSTVESVSLID